MRHLVLNLISVIRHIVTRASARADLIHKCFSFLFVHLLSMCDLY